MKHHPITKLFPPLSASEYAALKESIRVGGLRNAVWAWKGEIIDGAHRDRACEELGIPVKTQEWDGGGSLVQFAWDQNEHRRHLTADQRAALAADYAEALKDEAEALQKTGKSADGQAGGRGKKKNLPPNSVGGFDHVPATGERAARAAKAARVGKTKVQEAINTKKADPALHEKVKEGTLSHAQAKRTLHRKQKEAELEAKAKAAPEPDEDAWRIVHGDCLAGMDTLRPASVRLAFADPPYNIGFDYGGGEDADRLPRPQYLAWCGDWMKIAARVLAPDGSFWVLINDESAAEFKTALEAAGLYLRQWLIWYESFGVNCARQFNRTHRHLFWAVKDARRFVFNEVAEVLRKSDREAKYNDRRAQPGGKLWDSVWGINPPVPRLTGTSAERLPDFPTQLPLALLTPIVACTSEPNDLVLDLFAGSGSMGEAAIRQGRRFIGFESSEPFAKKARLRLRAVV